MKPFNTPTALIFGVITLFSVSNANAGGCSFHTQNNVEIECLSEDKKCIDAQDKKLLYKVEA